MFSLGWPFYWVVSRFRLRINFLRFRRRIHVLRGCILCGMPGPSQVFPIGGLAFRETHLTVWGNSSTSCIVMSPAVMLVFQGVDWTSVVMSSARCYSSYVRGVFLILWILAYLLAQIFTKFVTDCAISWNIFFSLLNGYVLLVLGFSSCGGFIVWRAGGRDGCSRCDMFR